MVNWLRNNILAIILAVLGIVAVILLVHRISLLTEQVRGNTRDIKEQSTPCSKEDVRYPEDSPGCETQKGGTPNKNNPSQGGGASGTFDSGSAGNIPSTANPQQQPRVIIQQPPREDPDPEEPGVLEGTIEDIDDVLQNATDNLEVVR